MLDNIVARASVGRVTDPLGRTLVGWGIPPDLVTVLGTVGSMAAALWFLPRGQLFVGVCVITAFVLLDLVDGAMARAIGPGTPFGAVLDSTCDRLADGALFAALTWWCLRLGDQPHTAVAAMISLVAGLVVSYLKARAERLILALAGTALEGLGVPGALAVALWLLAVGSVITLGQRLVAVHRSAAANSLADSASGDSAAVPAGEPAVEPSAASPAASAAASTVLPPPAPDEGAQA